MTVLNRYHDRIAAGEVLATELVKYNHNPSTVVIGLPRGGVVTAAVVAKRLHLPLDVTCPRKIGSPWNPEYAVGAVTEKGEPVIHWEAVRTASIDESTLKEIIEKQTAEATHRVNLYRNRSAGLEVSGQVVLLVDDGVATGSTVEAAIQSLKSSGAKKIILAVPVAPHDTLERLRDRVDEIYCPLIPNDFYAVGQFYDVFEQVEDEEVCRLLKTQSR